MRCLPEGDRKYLVVINVPEKRRGSGEYLPPRMAYLLVGRWYSVLRVLLGIVFAGEVR